MQAHSPVIPAFSWQESIFCMNRSPIKDLGDDAVQGATVFLIHKAEIHGQSG